MLSFFQKPSTVKTDLETGIRRVASLYDVHLTTSKCHLVSLSLSILSLINVKIIITPKQTYYQDKIYVHHTTSKCHLVSLVSYCQNKHDIMAMLSKSLNETDKRALSSVLYLRYQNDIQKQVLIYHK